jgi:hypothetical protein
MKLQMPDGARWFFLVAALILCLPRICFADPRGGNPHIHVDERTGDDSNDGMSDTAPVTSSNGKWTRVQELGIMGSDTGIVPTYVTDTPDIHWVRQAMKEKPDRSHRRTVRIYGNHGELPDEDIEESEMTGVRVRVKYTWIPYTAINGAEGIKLISIIQTAEVY